MFFILWNIDAFAVHLLDEQIHAVVVSREAPFHIKISTMEGLEWIRLFYYLAKLDHLLCVPAMIFLYLALKNLLRESPTGDNEEPVVNVFPLLPVVLVDMFGSFLMIVLSIMCVHLSRRLRRRDTGNILWNLSPVGQLCIDGVRRFPIGRPHSQTGTGSGIS